MFESFYGLTRTPFSRDIPTDQLYQSHLLEETLGRLEYTAQRQMFAVLVISLSEQHRYKCEQHQFTE